jgi:hypothetical protein
MSVDHRSVAFTTPLLALTIILARMACRTSEMPVKPSMSVFTSPDDASKALMAAAKSDDQNTLLTIFGPDSKQVILSGDAVQDRIAITSFASGYEVMHRWQKSADGSQLLLVGADNFPFPIPLKKNSDGKWFFDTAAGKDEVLNRRIGRNELAIIDVCEGIREAQTDYVSTSHNGARQYATKFVSDSGKQNGLYWKPADGQPPSPLGPLAAAAASEGYSDKPEGHGPFHGYYFCMLMGQSDKAPGGARDYVINGKMTGGYAFVAYPAEYGNSGVMTFMMNQDGVLLQKDLGKTTREAATAMNTFDPDAAWNIVEE